MRKSTLVYDANMQSLFNNRYSNNYDPNDS
jgi:hypothetical protein